MPKARDPHEDGALGLARLVWSEAEIAERIASAWARERHKAAALDVAKLLHSFIDAGVDPDAVEAAARYLIARDDTSGDVRTGAGYVLAYLERERRDAERARERAEFATLPVAVPKAPPSPPVEDDLFNPFLMNESPPAD